MFMYKQRQKTDFSPTFVGVQAVEKVTTREIGISCNLLPAPSLGAQPINVPTLDESFATEETDSIQDEVEDPEESFQSIESDDTDGSDLG